MSFHHVTIMRDEVVAAIAPRADGVYADVTLGGGGHTEALLQASEPSGRVIGVDRDPNALDAARARLEKFGARVTFTHSAFAQLDVVLAEQGVSALDGLVADLGVSSPQLDHSERGFSFARSGPLDMRMDPTQGLTAKELIESLEEEELANVIYELGEDRKSRSIARSIKRAEREGVLETTTDLREAVYRAIGGPRGGLDPATRTFQALRIAVNAELAELDALLEMLPRVLAEGGVAAIISFHSLEDRRVKHFFRDSDDFEPMTKKPIIASEQEQASNPRSRSAKLRVARRCAPQEESV